VNKSKQGSNSFSPYPLPSTPYLLLLCSLPPENPMNNQEQWYVVRLPTGNCDILPSQEVEGENDTPEVTEKWGPFTSQGEAIARRVGLIRAGKCQPA
jgi:hypothetical protein